MSKKGNDRKKEEEGWENPISKDRITETPGSILYPHHVGGFKIEPTEKSIIKHRSQSAMLDQTKMQLDQIYRQMELLAEQAKEIKNRVEVSEWVYQAEYSFEPLVNHTYHLYQKNNGKYCLSLIGPNDWGKSSPFAEFISSVTLLADRTWRVEKP